MPIMYPHLLKRIPLFALLDDDEVTVLSENLDQKRVFAGKVIFNQGDPGGQMFIVQSGKVEIFIRDDNEEKVILSYVESGGIFGELSLLDNEPRSACARALEDSFLFIVDRHDLDLLFAKHSDAAMNILTMLSKRIREADSLVQKRVVTRNVNEETATLTFSQRLADFFASIAGDMRFFYFSVIWFGTWIIWNLGLIPGVQPFDPFPFGLLTMIVSLEAIFLSTFVMISQNRQAEREKVRNDIEYEINVKAELEVREVNKKLDAMEELLVSHLSAVRTNISKLRTDQVKTQSNEEPLWSDE